MQNVFLELVKLSLIGSLFAAAVMLVRLVFRKAPKWLFCVLWGVVALRLICPVSIESNVSLVPDRLASGQIITNVGNEYIGDVDIIYESNAGYSNAIEAGRQPIFSDDGYYVVTEKDSLEAPKTVGQTVYPVLSWIWVAGMILMLAYTAVSYLLLRKRMEEATQLRDNIWQCEQVDSPFVLGFIKPRIYLPYEITDGDMANVIAHEQAHIQRKDHWWKPIGFLLLSVHWFNPVLWLAYILLCRDIEAACDEKVIKHMEKDEMRAYSTALLNCSVHRRRIAACPLAFGETGVKERIKRVMNYKKPAFWIIITAIVLCAVVAVCFLTTPAASSEFAINGNNVSDLNVDEIITRIRKVQRLGDGNAYTNPGNFSLTIDSDFNWVESQAVRYFFYKEHEVHSAQIRIFPDEEKVFLTESSEWLEQEQVFLLRHYLDAVKYLPQDEISKTAPADKYLIRHVAEGRPSSYSRVIIYTPNGVENTDDWLIHLQLEPLHAAEEGYVGTGEEVIHLFYADKTDPVGDISKLLTLVNSIANNPDCAASSNPFTFIEAKKPLYNEILTYGSTAVDFFVEQLRTGENGLQGYIMAVACADITGIGDKDLGADWATAQEWLALYDKSDKSTIIPPVIATDYISGKQARLLSFGYTSDKAGQSVIACGIAPYQGDYSDTNTLILDGESGQNQILLTPRGASFSQYRICIRGFNINESITTIAQKKFYANTRTVTISRYSADDPNTVAYQKTKIELLYDGESLLKYVSNDNGKVANFEKVNYDGFEFYLHQNQVICYLDNHSPVVVLPGDTEPMNDERLGDIYRALIEKGNWNFYEQATKYLVNYDSEFIKPYIERHMYGQFNQQETDMLEKMQIKPTYIQHVAKCIGEQLHL